MLGKTMGWAPGRPNPGGKRVGGRPLTWNFSFKDRASKRSEPSDFLCCCCVCGLLRPGGGLFATSPLSSSSTVQAFFKVGKDNRGWAFGGDRFKGLPHTPGRGTIPSLSNTKCDKLSSISILEIFCKEIYKAYKIYGTVYLFKKIQII